MNDTSLPRNPRLATRWHQEPLAWLVFGLPAVVVVASLATLYIAMDRPDTLVVDDYYKKGLEINKVLAREDAAKAAGLDFRAELAADGVLTLRFVAQPGFAWPATLDVQVNHATEGGRDRQLQLAHGGDGVYVGKLTGLAAGPWYLDASTPAWRVVKRVTVDNEGKL